MKKRKKLKELMYVELNYSEADIANIDLRIKSIDLQILDLLRRKNKYLERKKQMMCL